MTHGRDIAGDQKFKATLCVAVIEIEGRPKFGMRADEPHEGAVTMLEEGGEMLAQERKCVLLSDSFHSIVFLRNCESDAPREPFGQQIEQGIRIALVLGPDELAVLADDVREMKDSRGRQPAGDLLEQVFEVDHVMDGGVGKDQIVASRGDRDEIEVGFLEVQREYFRLRDVSGFLEDGAV